MQRRCPRRDARIREEPLARANRKILPTTDQPYADLVLGGSVDLVSLLSNGPYGAYYGFLWWLIGGY